MRTLGPSLLLCVIAACSCDPDSLNKICPSSCYTADPTTVGAGQCRLGAHPICDEQFNVVECPDEVIPSAELCNGIDDDCDGYVDDRPHDERLEKYCGYPLTGHCFPGVTRCIKGEVVCFGGQGPEEERCQPVGIDWNCDGIPNNLPLNQFCYSGDPSNLLYANADCKAGVRQCLLGKEVCMGERLPAEEECGALRDKNCNGYIDDVDDENILPTDIVFLIDRSGSMVGRYPVIIPALIDFVKAHSQDAYKYALINVPGNNEFYTPEVGSDFVDSLTMIEQLEALSPNLGGLTCA